MLFKKKLLTNSWVVCILALVCCLLWGSAFPCVKLGYRMFHVEAVDWAGQILFAGVRFALAGVLVILIGSVASKTILFPKCGRQFRHIMKLSLFQTILQYFFFYIGLARTSGVKASIIEGTNVFVAILVAALCFHMEKVTRQKLWGCLLGFAGVVLVNARGTGMDWNMHWMGEGFIFLSTFAYAVSSVLLKRFSKEDSPLLLSGYQFLVGGLVMAAVGSLMGGRLSFTGAGIPEWGMLFYLALISAVAYSLWGILLKYNDVSRVAVYGFMNPVFGVLLSAWLLEERDLLGTHSLIALVLVCMGIFLVNREELTGSTEEEGR